MKFEHHQAVINGISMHYVEAGKGLPLILCHGFPHIWYSWHRQMSYLADAGYRVIAPDMRGMGRTEAPPNPEQYDIDHITSDLLGLMDHLGIQNAVFGGLDFGAFAIYDLALRHPDRVLAVIGLQNPAAPHNPDESPLTEYRRMGEEHFLHIEYFRVPPRADLELAAQPRRFLHKVFHTLSGAGNYFNVFKSPPGASYIDAMDEPPGLPWSWLSAQEFEVFVQEYTRSGFTGGLNWYRSFDLKWEQRKPFEGVSSAVPAYFLGSEHDVDLEGFHGDDPISQMRAIFPQLREVRMIPEAGHMMQLEASEQVNAILLEFLGDIERKMVS
ncbi:MAG: alpha/beta fold hydrolase [Halioglobus sp.]